MDGAKFYKKPYGQISSIRIASVSSEPTDLYNDPNYRCIYGERHGLSTMDDEGSRE